MMNKRVIIVLYVGLLAALPLCSLSQEVLSASLVKHRKQGDSTLYVRLGADEPLSGAFKFIQNDHAYELAHFRDGRLDGSYKRFVYGQCVTEGVFRDSRKDKSWRFYSIPFERNDAIYLKQTAFYLDGLPHGEWVRYETTVATDLKPVAIEKIQFNKGYIELRETFSEEGWRMTSCTYRNNVKHGREMGYYADGKVMKETEYRMGMRTGISVLYHPNGQLAERGGYDERGEATGKWETWAENGILTGWAHYQAGKLVGPFEYYHDNGTMRQQGSYADDGSGAFIGDYRRWYENGNPAEVSRTDNKGRKQGKEQRWYENGNLQLEANYRDGILVGERRTYFENGQPEELTTYSTREQVADEWGAQATYAKSGPYKRYNAEGQLLEEGEYAHDKKEGTWKTYLDGKLRRMQDFEDGLESGAYTLYNEGRIRETGTYKIVTDTYGNRRAVKDGLWVEYYYEVDYPEGLKRWEVHWKDGNKHGKAFRYDTSGKVSLEEQYEHGRRIQ